MTFAERNNPFCVLCYLFFVIFITMFSQNPILLGISFVSSILLYLLLSDAKKTAIKIGYNLLFVVIFALLNPVFSHKGMTILLEVGNFVVTLEAIVYGVAIGVMFASSINWFSVCNILLNSDKIVYIFSKYTPKIGTILSISLGLLPKYKRQYKKTDDNLKALGLYENIKWYQKVKLKIHVMSTLITWAIENSLTLSDSMSARGYDLKGKKVYSKYVFRIYDLINIFLFASVGISVLTLLGLGYANYFYYPTFKTLTFGWETIIYIVVALLMNYYTFIILGEKAKWQLLKSKI